MNTQHTVLLMGAFAKVMELSRTHCSVLAEQTTITLRALNHCPEIPLTLKAQIEEMLDSIEEQYQLDRTHKDSGPDSQSDNLFCIHTMQIRNAPLYSDASLV